MSHQPPQAQPVGYVGLNGDRVEFSLDAAGSTHASFPKLNPGEEAPCPCRLSSTPYHHLCHTPNCNYQYHGLQNPNLWGKSCSNFLHPSPPSGTHSTEPSAQPCDDVNTMLSKASQREEGGATDLFCTRQQCPTELRVHDEVSRCLVKHVPSHSVSRIAPVTSGWRGQADRKVRVF